MSHVPSGHRPTGKSSAKPAAPASAETSPSSEPAPLHLQTTGVFVRNLLLIVTVPILAAVLLMKVCEWTHIL